MLALRSTTSNVHFNIYLDTDWNVLFYAYVIIKETADEQLILKYLCN